MMFGFFLPNAIAAGAFRFFTFLSVGGTHKQTLIQIHYKYDFSNVILAWFSKMDTWSA